MAGPLAPVINSLLQELSQGVKEKRTALQTHWPEIVGTLFSRHTKPQLQARNTLCVWVDDSTLACELNQKHQGTVLKRAEAVLGEGNIQKIIFRVGEIR